MKPVSPELKKYIDNALTKSIYHPSLALCACIDAIFTGDEDPENDKWWTFEYETVLQMMERLGYKKPTPHILDQIQCIGAIRNGKSFFDKEWHIFEDSVAALTGIPVLPDEKQNLPIENVIHAMRIMPNFGTTEFSDEVKHYIGSEGINDDIFWYPIKDVDKYIYEAIERIEYELPFRMDEIKKIREDVQKKFESLRKENIENINFKEDSMVDQMCKRIMWSLLNFSELQRKENEELTLFCAIRDGKIDFNDIKKSPSQQKDIGEDYSDVENDESIILDNTGEVTRYEDGINPDDEAEVMVLDFNDGVKEASMDIINNTSDDFIMPFDDMYHGQSIKIASFIGGGIDALGYAVQAIQTMTKMASLPHPYGLGSYPAQQVSYDKREVYPGLTDVEPEVIPAVKTEDEKIMEMMNGVDETAPDLTPDPDVPDKNTDLEKTSQLIIPPSVEETANGRFVKCGILNYDPFKV